MKNIIKNNELSIIITILFFILVNNMNAYAQHIDNTAQQTPTDSIKTYKKIKKTPQKDSTKLIKKLIKAGDNIFYAQQKNYTKALELYLEAKEIGAHSQALLYKIGLSYFHLKKYNNSLKYFNKLLPADSNTNKKTFYYLGRLNALHYHFDKAISDFNTYKRKLSPDELSIQGKEIKKRIRECTIAKELVANPIPVFIDRLNSNINTQYVEYAPIVSFNDSILIFTSRRPCSSGHCTDNNGVYYEDVYISKKDSTGHWGKAKNMGKPINTPYHDAGAGLSADASKLFIYRSDNDGDLYYSELKEGQWTKPKKLNANINSKAHESTASLSYDNMKLYFSSNREGGYGGQDIYQSDIDEKGNWGPAKNLMGKINTPYDEVNFIPTPDGKTYYFSSNGHNSMGGLDIFKVSYKDSTWSTPVNLGYPINTPDDDVIYSLSADGTRAYIASSKSDSTLHDIYMITFAGKVKKVVDNIDGTPLAIITTGPLLPAIEPLRNIKKLNLTVLKGKITDQYTHKPVYAQIELTDNASNTIVATFNSNEKTGEYLVSLPSGKDYGIAVKAEDYLFYSDNIAVKKASKGYKEIIKNIALMKIAVGSKVVLKNIFFATGKSTLTKSSETELQNLLKLLNDIPTLKIEVSGHTDNVGSAKKNQILSKKRAQAVVNYLIKHGIAKNRLISKGYGFTQPIASNKTKAGRQQNRRTEFKVLAR